MSRGKIITVSFGQTIEDIALQEYGSLQGSVLLMLDNPDQINNLNEELYAGQRLKIKSEVINKDVVDAFQAKGKVPNTGVFTQGEFNNDFNEDFNT